MTGKILVIEIQCFLGVTKSFLVNLLLFIGGSDLSQAVRRSVKEKKLS